MPSKGHDDTNGHVTRSNHREDIAGLHRKMDKFIQNMHEWQREQERRLTRIEVGYAVGAVLGVAVVGLWVSQVLG